MVIEISCQGVLMIEEGLGGRAGAAGSRAIDTRQVLAALADAGLPGRCGAVAEAAKQLLYLG
jgi:hypothetical protein